MVPLMCWLLHLFSVLFARCLSPFKLSPVKHRVSNCPPVPILCGTGTFTRSLIHAFTWLHHFTCRSYIRTRAIHMLSIYCLCISAVRVFYILNLRSSPKEGNMTIAKVAARNRRSTHTQRQAHTWSSLDEHTRNGTDESTPRRRSHMATMHALASDHCHYRWLRSQQATSSNSSVCVLCVHSGTQCH